MTGRVIITPYNIELETQQKVQCDGYPITGFNLAPGKPLSILRNQQGYELITALWGFTPQWLKDLKRAPYVIRIESLESSPMYRESWSQHRCLLPVTGYYLWKQGKQAKQAFAIRRPENRPFFLAGLWTRYRIDSLTSHDSFALLSAPVRQSSPALSDRLPLALHVDQITSWLDPNTPISDCLQLLQSSKVDLECYPVSSLVNSPHNTSIEVTHSLGRRQQFGASF
ncbi:SOS response-associated peptidase [Marinospirillum sp.]|uniref:SOS response-associated peptidase n=1 Tax=Marinospirillum sp. TaxID=2183934 RepID=UPI003A8854C7